MTEAEFLSTGYQGLETGIVAITAVFTLVFAYIGGLHFFLKEEPVLTRLAVFILFIGAYAFLHMFLYSASLFGQDWLDARLAADGVNASGDGLSNFYAANSATIMRWVWAIIAAATLGLVTIETFRNR
ncbi:hypothetical protein [Pyruvatibacter sp.]|uniref:hypothetical protein n=1 Tax=Pyruvatibacter sp. TaxID=1981328 RepID=UPI0032633358